MKTSFWCCGIISLYCLHSAHANLQVQVAEPKYSGDKATIKLELKNTFTEKIDSARAVVFLIDDQGKMVGQATRWVIGGEKGRPALLPNAITTYSFVVSTEKPFATTKLNFTRVVLEGGNVADATKSVTIIPASK